ncbi:MAG TPA: hypothetical protein VFQ91_11810, partial [Bryobacteraceae bacterium]|nr:hypothetical protein [Bryobacteraceae bacterium]
MSVTIEKQEWKGWPNCWRLSNGTVELIVTQDIGPRVMRYAFVGGQNLFKEFTDQLGKSGESSWCIRGGHRLWKGPEDYHATYALDNSSIDIQTTENTLIATQLVEPETGLQKRIELQLADSGTEVIVKHTIWNRGLLPVELAAWTPTVMAQTGLGVTGFPPRGTHPEDLEPTNPLIMWAFTDLTDPRWKFTKKYLTLRQDPENRNPQKLGHWNGHTFGAYFLNGDVFLKEYFPTPGMTHPEFGASFEIFTN